MLKTFSTINLLAFAYAGISNFAMIFLPIYLVSIGMNGIQMGVLISMGIITAIFASIPIGIISDRFSIRAAFAFAALLGIIFFAGLFFAREFWILFLLFIMWGITRETNSRCLEIFTLKTTEQNNKGKKIGVFSLWRYFGAAIGTLIGGALLVYLAFGFTFALVAFLFLLLLIPISKLEKIPTANISMQVYSKEFLNLRTILFSVALFFFTLHWGAEHTSYGLYLSNSLHLNTFLMGAYISIPIFFLGLFAYFGGQWIDRKHISHRKIFIIGIFVSGLGQIMMVNPDVFISFGWRVFHEIGDGLFFVSQLVWVSLLFGQKSIGGNYGMVYTIMVLGAFAGALVFAPLGEAQGYGTPLVISGAILVIESFLIAGYFALRRAWN